MTIFRGFRRLLEALELIALALSEIVAVQKDAGRALERLDTLELSRHKFEAECEGKLLQADGKLKAANNAEARERQLKKFHERLSDEFAPDGGEGAPEYPIPIDDAQPSDEERLQAMRLVVAPSNKAQALAAKWA